jgi:transcriptional regulator with XRE-family HTH domain
MDIKSRLDKAMRDAGFKTQMSLSVAAEVPQATISRILKGVNDPELPTLRKLAAACEVNFEWLNEGIGPQRRGEKAGEVSQRHERSAVLVANKVDTSSLERLNEDEVRLVRAYRDLEKDKDRQAALMGQARFLVAKSLKESAARGFDQTERPDQGE